MGSHFFSLRTSICRDAHSADLPADARKRGDSSSLNHFGPSWSSARCWTSAGGELLGCSNRKKKQTLSCRTGKDVLHLAQRSFYTQKKCKLELERLMTIDPTATRVVHRSPFPLRLPARSEMITPSPSSVPHGRVVGVCFRLLARSRCILRHL